MIISGSIKLMYGQKALRELFYYDRRSRGQILESFFEYAKNCDGKFFIQIAPKIQKEQNEGKNKLAVSGTDIENCII